MNTYLLTWNPSRKGADGAEWLEDIVDHLGNANSKRDQWSTGINRSIEAGQRIFLLRQGHDSPGMIGSGKVTKGWFEDDHWDPQKNAAGLKANYVKVEWDSMVLPNNVVSRQKLLKGILPASLVNAQSSGREIEAKVAARFEVIWSNHLKAIYSNASLKTKDPNFGQVGDDTYDDLGEGDSRHLGSDGAPKTKQTTSGFRRNPYVRRAVAKRSKRICERTGCGESRDYAGFIDVHHILGAGKGDRVWNCVALCPNCHREAHYDPNRKDINKQLLQFAMRFKWAQSHGVRPRQTRTSTGLR